MLFKFNPEVANRAAEMLTLGSRQIPLIFKRNTRARRYILRLDRKGHACVTVPRSGSTAEARRFAEGNRPWLERQLQRLASLPCRPKEWLLGTTLFWRGELVKLEASTGGEKGVVQLGSESIRAADLNGDLRGAVERHLWRLAWEELPPKVLEHAAAQGLQVRRVCVRNQRSRWGSCSRRATISLNWRLVQTPPLVCDYIIVHELMHLRHMNHSARFWSEVERAFPDYRLAERWLKEHSALLQ